VKCTALCPGVTRTEFFQVAGQKITLYQGLTMMDSATVACIGINAMLRGRSSVVAGWLNALLAGCMGFIPRSWAAGLAHWVMNM
jgi:short-subunit dehydrogenase